MFCSYCGNKISDDAKFCSYCGKGVVSVKSVQQTAEQPADRVNTAAISAVQSADALALSETLKEENCPEQASAVEESAQQPVSDEQPIEQADEQPIEQIVEQPTESFAEPQYSADITTAQTAELAEQNAETENIFAPEQQDEFTVPQTQLPEQKLESTALQAPEQRIDYPVPQQQSPERKYTLTHLLMCLASTAIFAIAAGVFAGLYFSGL